MARNPGLNAPTVVVFAASTPTLIPNSPAASNYTYAIANGGPGLLHVNQTGSTNTSDDITAIGPSSSDTQVCDGPVWVWSTAAGSCSVVAPDLAASDARYGRTGLYAPHSVPAQASIDLAGASIMTTNVATQLGGTTQTVGVTASAFDPRIRVISGTSFVNATFAQGRALTSGAGKEPLILEVETDAPIFEILEVSAGAGLGGIRYFIDGVLVLSTATSVFTGTDGTNLFRKFDYSAGAGRKRRRIRMECSGNAGFRTLKCLSIDSVWLPTYPQKPLIAGIGDSYKIGSGTTSLTPMDGMGWVCADLLGGEKLILASGGTGFLANNSVTGRKFRERIRDDLVATGRLPKLIVIGSGCNDIPLNTVSARAEMDLTFAYLNASFPGVPVVCWGPAPSVQYQYNVAATIAIRDQLKASCLANGIHFVDCLAGIAYDSAGNIKLNFGQPWVKGTGYTGSTNASGPSDVLIASDQLHPTDAGHALEGALLAQGIAACLDLPVYPG